VFVGTKVFVGVFVGSVKENAKVHAWGGCPVGVSPEIAKFNVQAGAAAFDSDVVIEFCF